jgi:hypothetical protein
MRSYNAERRLKKGINVVIGALRFAKATEGKVYTPDPTSCTKNDMKSEELQGIGFKKLAESTN